MASENTITVSGQIVQWLIKDPAGTSGATGNLFWWSTAGGDVIPTTYPNNPGMDDTATYWMVSKIQFIPSTAATTGSFVRLYEDSTVGPILVNHMFNSWEEGKEEWNFVPPLCCRPVFASSTGSGAYTTPSYFIFHLA